jgi:hypothetical protein
MSSSSSSVGLCPLRLGSMARILDGGVAVRERLRGGVDGRRLKERRLEVVIMFQIDVSKNLKMRNCFWLEPAMLKFQFSSATLFCVTKEAKSD